MTEASQTDYTKRTTIKADPEDLIEAVEESVRNVLGLRAVKYRTHEKKGSHPDQRPCPSWCWVARDSEYDHEINVYHPMTAEHHLDVRMPIVASHYRADQDGREVRPATIECTLAQRGQEAPRIAVHLRQFGPDAEPFAKILTLAITDAEELAAVLQHLVKLADS